ncbi:MAG TPA: hypothetical protein VKS78_06860 [Roseiarcus sp.]|nr:hypothetical protein [Roseiarcus sp.]
MIGGYGGGYGGYGGYGGFGGAWGGIGDWGWSGWGGDYLSNFEGLWGADVIGLAGLTAGIATSDESCIIYNPIYNTLGQYIGVQPLNICNY